jgi:HD-GYP domain-containing protein (c-di-GMP phosphodiesterase class II)
LAKEQIPRLARLVAVADAFDAMTSDRPYHKNKKGRPPEEAFAEVEAQAGRQFDPECAAAFLEIQGEILRIMHELMPAHARVNDSFAAAQTISGLPTPQPIGSISTVAHASHSDLE